MCHVFASGNCSLRLSRREPGKLSHAKWILKAYVPPWFKIKPHSSCKNVAHHTCKSASFTSYLCNYLKIIIDPVILNNAYFDHMENI